MRIARLARPQGAVFAVADGAREGWIPLDRLGIDVGDTPALVSRLDEVRDAIDGADGGQGDADPRLLCPVIRPGKIVAVGLNYRDHIRETGMDTPERPLLFAKYPSSLNGPFDDIVFDPTLTARGDYEVELAVIVGRRVTRISDDEALTAVAGFAVANDVSARDWQFAESQWSRSKSFDTFCPIGPWITTADEVPDPQVLGLRATVNGEVRQDSSTKEMLFGVRTLLAYVSEGITLEPGDVILTGTPHGVGFAMDPPVYLAPGDEVTCEIERLGRISNRVVAPQP